MSRRTIGSAMLILSGLGLIGGLAQLFLAGRSTPGSDLGFAVTVAGLGLFVIVDPGRARQMLTGRTARYGSNALLMSVAFLGLVAVANAFVSQHGLDLDLTEDRQFSLSPQSVQVLDGLKQKVHALAFFADDDPGRAAVDDLLKAYARQNPRLTYEFVDPEKSPDRARAYGVDAFGATVFERGDQPDRRQKVTLGPSEQNYTAALLRLSRDESRKVYVLTGHDERKFDDESANGYMVAQQALRREGYDVQPLTIAAAGGQVPPDATVLIVAAPAKPLLPEEEAAIAGFVDRGGGLLVLGDVRLEPAPLAGLLKRWGVDYNSDGLVDPETGLFGDVSTPVVTKFEYEPVTQGLAAAFFPGARSLALNAPSPDVLLYPLARSSANSWGETDFANRQVNYDAGADHQGPLTLAVAVETKTTEVEQLTGGKPKVRIVATGDSDFAANTAFNRLSNGDLFLNAVNWLGREEVLLAIDARPDRLRGVTLTASDMRAIFYSGTVFLPLAVLLLGGVIWWRRR